MNSRRSVRLPLAALLIAMAAIAAPLVASAGTTGKITGTVRERGKTALPGVTVVVEGTRLGAIADDQGRYSILNVPAGTYSVRGRIVGFADYIATNVEVRADFTTELNLELASEAVQQAPVIVESTRPLIQKDATGTAPGWNLGHWLSLPGRLRCRGRGPPRPRVHSHADRT